MTVYDILEKIKRIDRLYVSLCDLSGSKDFGYVDIDDVTELLMEYKEELLSKKVME